MFIEINEGQFSFWWQGIVPKHIAVIVGGHEVFMLTEGGYSNKPAYEKDICLNSGTVYRRLRWKRKVFGVGYRPKNRAA